MTGAQTGLGGSQGERENKTDYKDGHVERGISVIMWVRQRQVNKLVIMFHSPQEVLEKSIQICPHAVTSGDISHIPAAWWR